MWVLVEVSFISPPWSSEKCEEFFFCSLKKPYRGACVNPFVNCTAIPSLCLEWLEVFCRCQDMKGICFESRWCWFDLLPLSISLSLSLSLSVLHSHVILQGLFLLFLLVIIETVVCNNILLSVFSLSENMYVFVSLHWGISSQDEWQSDGGASQAGHEPNSTNHLRDKAPVFISVGTKTEYILPPEWTPFPSESSHVWYRNLSYKHSHLLLYSA